jgi:hypothetical protein
MNEPLKLHFADIQNVGDQLSPFLAAIFSGREVVNVPADHDEPFHAMIGSSLGWLNDNAIVWGTGIIAATAKPPAGATYKAVRGPLTREAVIAAGGRCDEVYGDAAILTPDILPIIGRISRPVEWAVILQRREAEQWQRFISTSAANFIHTRTADVANFVSHIAGATKVLSSSLHGLILAHAYGIPAAWLKCSDLPMGDGLKFRDYLLSAGLDDRPIEASTVTTATLREADRRVAIPKETFAEFRSAFAGFRSYGGGRCH